MKTTHIPAPSPDPNSPHTPVWTPSQFKGAARVKMRKPPELEDMSLGETIANAVSTGVGAALSIAALVILIVVSVMHGGGSRLLAALAFGVPMLLAFLMSTLYHAIPAEMPKLVFRILGHCFVFLYIAGALTPYCVLVAADANGLVVCGFAWLLAFVGIIVESVWLSRPRWVSLALCAAMVVVGCLIAPHLAAVLPAPGWWLLVAAFACGLVGAAFYVFRNVPYLWFVSHLAIIAGSILLFLSVVLFVL